MKAVFADTVGLLASWDVRDQWHDAAEKALQILIQSRTPLITTSFIMLECANAASRRPYRQQVARLLSELEFGGFLIHPTDDDWRTAWDAYARGNSGSAGVVDHVSFQVMRRLGINRAFTNDRHFLAAGFEVLF